ncbi:MAG: hypothetical protein QXS20_00725 [Candidatus Thorarchaeota archaeon]
MVKMGLRERGIICHSAYVIHEESGSIILLSFPAKEGNSLTPARVERALNALGLGEFSVHSDFARLSAAFLHLEVSMGSRTESERESSAR